MSSVGSPRQDGTRDERERKRKREWENERVRESESERVKLSKMFGVIVEAKHASMLLAAAAREIQYQQRFALAFNNLVSCM